MTSKKNNGKLRTGALGVRAQVPSLAALRGWGRTVRACGFIL